MFGVAVVEHGCLLVELPPALDAHGERIPAEHASKLGRESHVRYRHLDGRPSSRYDRLATSPDRSRLGRLPDDGFCIGWLRWSWCSSSESLSASFGQTPAMLPV